MCDKKNSVLFTDTECVVLSPDFKLLDENHVLLRVPRKDNMYSVDLKNIVPSGGLTCLFAKATLDESNLWHRRLGHINFKTINKLVKENLVRGIENLIDLKVKVIRCDNGTEFKNKVMNQFCEIKGRKHALRFMRPFGCPVTILNTIDHLGKFDGKADEGFFVGYSTNSKTFRVFNSRTKIVEENLHVKFSEETPNIAGNGPNWLFDIDALTKSMNYEPLVAGNQSNGIAGTKACENAGKATVETVPGKDYILLPFLTQDPPFSSSSKDSPDAGFKPSEEKKKKDVEHLENEDSKVPNIEEPRVNQENDENINSTNIINIVSSTVNTASIMDNVVDENTVYGCADDPNMPNLEEIIYSEDDEDVGAEADMNNLDTFIPVSLILTTRIHKDHPFEQIIRDLHSAPQTRRITKSVTEHEPKKVIQALKDPSWIEAMQEELMQFKLQQGYTQEDGIDYDEVFAPVARIEAIRLLLAYASFKDFVVYYMDVKSAFLYGKIEEELYRGTIDKTLFIKKVKGDILLVQVYVDDIIFGSTKKSLCTEFEKLMHKKFQMSSMGELTFFLGLQVTQKNDGIFISQDKYVDEILKKFGFSTVKTASTPIETSKPLMKDENAEDVDVHLYRSMIGSLMYLTSSRPDIMFVVCACARFQVTPKVSHLHAVKRIFRYLKGQPKLGLWYPKDSPFDLEAYTDSDYAGASLDRKSTTGAAYVAASHCCGQVLWIQNQLLDYGYNFMNTKIFIDNESTICIVKNPVFHLKTKYIEIRHHFIRDSYEKGLIQVLKIHTDHNVADLLIKAFDVSSGFCTNKCLKWNGTAANDGIKVSAVRLTYYQGKDFSRTMTSLFATMLIRPQEDVGEGSGQPTEPQHTPTIASPSTIEPIPIIASSSQPQKTHKHWKTKMPTKVSQSSGPTTLVVDETVHEERGDSMEMAATTTANLDAEQDSGNIIRTQSMATLNEPIPQGTGSGSGLRRQDTILGDSPAQTRFERLSKQSNDPPLSRDLEITSLKKRVKKLEKKKKARTPQLKRRLFKVRIESSADKSLGDQEDASKQGRNEDEDEDISWFQEDAETQGRYAHDINVTTASAPITTAGVSVSTAEPSTPPTTTTTTLIENEDLIIS
ncbi:putative ribonuclease H-like domain-containing protein [Tanacetum coccineum]